MGQAPSEVADGETIVRVILHPFHFDSKGRLKPQAFESPRSLSYSFRTQHFVSAGENIALQSKVPKSTRDSLLFARLQFARSLTPKHDCPAHADIRYGYVRPQQDEPGTPREIEALRSRLKELIRNVKYYPDQDVTAEQWTGDAVTAPA